jgi:hypothetical protein
MRRPLILYSTNTWLAFNIAERYYRGRHYIWCTPFFNGRSDKGEAEFVPPTSCPWEIYRSLYGEMARWRPAQYEDWAEPKRHPTRRQGES